MTAASYIRTEALVLRLTPYSESSLIAAVLTPAYGQVHLLLKGARQTGRKRFPEVDLFRRLDVIYKPSPRTDLHGTREVAALANHDAIGRSPPHFAVAAWLCRTVLGATLENVASPRAFAALDLAFARLAEHPGEPLAAHGLGVCLIVLEEHGLLPDLDEGDHRRGAMQAMLRFAVDPSAAPPTYESDRWARLIAWVRTWMEKQHLKPPPAWPRLTLASQATSREGVSVHTDN